jgi:hypothetical protein
VARAQPGVSEVHAEGGRISFVADDRSVAELSQALVEAGALIKALAPQGASLEELFFSLTEDGRGAATQDRAGQAGEPVEAGR